MLRFSQVLIYHCSRDRDPTVYHVLHAHVIKNLNCQPGDSVQSGCVDYKHYFLTLRHTARRCYDIAASMYRFLCQTEYDLSVYVLV